MKNFVQDGDILTMTAPSGGVTSGTGVKIGSHIGISAITVAAGVLFTMKTRGVFDHASATSQAWTAGDLLYWDDTAKVFTKTSTSNTKAGIAVADKLAAAAVGRVKLVASI